MSVVIAEHLTIDQWLDLHFPDPGPADLIRLEAKSRRDYGNVSYFFTRRGGRWHFPPDARINFDEPSACVSRNRDTEMTLSPLLYQHSPMPNAPARLPLLWACLPLKIVASRFDPALGAVDAESERTAFARLDACSPNFTLVLHEGRRLTAFWRLRESLPAPAEPLQENRSGPWGDKPEAKVQRVLWHLAQKLNGSRDDLDPRRVTFAIPGTPMAGVYPTRLVTVTLGPDVGRRFAIDEL